MYMYYSSFGPRLSPLYLGIDTNIPCAPIASLIIAVLNFHTEDKYNHELISSEKQQTNHSYCQIVIHTVTIGAGKKCMHAFYVKLGCALHTKTVIIIVYNPTRYSRNVSGRENVSQDYPPLR